MNFIRNMLVDSELYQKNVRRRILSKSRQIILMWRLGEFGDLDTRLRSLSHIKHWNLVVLISLFMIKHVKTCLVAVLTWLVETRIWSTTRLQCFMYYWKLNLISIKYSKCYLEFFNSFWSGIQCIILDH